MVIKSLETDQSIILNNILKLNKLTRFDVDLTYGNGAFYKKVPEPLIKLDIDPNLNNCINADSTNTGLNDTSQNSVVFDPPFLTYVRAARKGNGDMVMSKRFSGYWTYQELTDHYINTITESYRILKKKGLLIFKCQDIIHNHKMHCTHVNVIQWAECVGFRLKDLFVLGAKHRMPSPNRKGVQKHARIFHCYFLVLEKC